MRAEAARTLDACAYDLEVWWGDEALWSERVVVAAARSGELCTPVAVELGGAPRLALVADPEGTWLACDDERVAMTGQDAVEHVRGALRVRVARATALATDDLRRGMFDVRRHVWTCASLAVHLVGLACMALMPPRASSLSLDLASDDLRMLRAQLLPPEPPTPDPAAPGPAAGGAPGAAGAAAGESTPRPRRPAAGRPRAPRGDVARDAGSAGILGVLRTFEVDPASPFATSNADEEIAALRALYGQLPGSGLAFGGLGMRGPGRGGGDGPLASIEVGGLHTSGGPGGVGIGHALPGRAPGSHTPRARPSGDAVVRGSLSREVIRRTIHRHLAEVRFCFETGLRARPELGGRVSVQFTIAPSGAVLAAQLGESQLAHDPTERCIVEAVRRWSFPAPEGGGVVVVSYPFLLEAD